MTTSKAQTEQSPGATGTIDASPAPPASLSAPASGRFHAVADSEIDGLKHLETPVALAVAAVCTGAVVAGVAPVLDILGRASRGPASLGLADVGWILVWAAAFGAALVALVVSIRRRSGLMDRLEAIRRRPRVPLPPEIDHGGRGRGPDSAPNPRERVKASLAQVQAQAKSGTRRKKRR